MPIYRYILLTKPRIVALSSFCAAIGMLLALPPTGQWAMLWTITTGLLGITLLSAAGFVLNCLIERRIDAEMSRTDRRPLATGEISCKGALSFALVLGIIGAAVLYWQVNLLTLLLTLGTFLGYAFVYTVFLKFASPQNIVIGGATGAMPPVLGWTAVTGNAPAEALVLFLIIFAWTPPHFWALALRRVEEYRRVGLPMLPVTHGSDFTRLNILLYTGLLTAVSILPYLVRMSGVFYLFCAVVLDGYFLKYAWCLLRNYSHDLAKETFGFSIVYLALLFSALLVDHYLAFFA